MNAIVAAVQAADVSTVTSRSGSRRAPAPAGSVAAAADRPAPANVPSAELVRGAVREALDRARLREWAERLDAASVPTALLVARPAPDGLSPHYPSAVAAYREMSEIISFL